MRWGSWIEGTRCGRGIESFCRNIETFCSITDKRNGSLSPRSWRRMNWRRAAALSLGPRRRRDRSPWNMLTSSDRNGSPVSSPGWIPSKGGWWSKEKKTGSWSLSPRSSKRKRHEMAPFLGAWDWWQTPWLFSQEKRQGLHVYGK